MNELDDDSRRDLLVGRERRLAETYEKARGVLFSSLGYIDDTIGPMQGFPKLTVKMLEKEIRPTLGPRLTAMCEALLALLQVREALAALDKDGK
jgi:hypothetical protein